MVRDMDRGRGEPREPGESPGAESPERSGGGKGGQGTERGGPSKLASGYGGPRPEQILTYFTF